MRQPILFIHMSLDGYVKAVGKDKTRKDKTIASAGDDPGTFETVVPELIAGSDTPLLGRRVADDLLEYWLRAEVTANYGESSAGKKKGTSVGALFVRAPRLS